MNEQKYIVTVEQLAKIVTYCLNMTVKGDGGRKDWTYNVETAIGLNGTSYLADKISLVEYKETEK